MTRTALPFLIAASLLASPALAQNTPLGAAGRWTIDLKASTFNEALTGPAPLTDTVRSACVIPVVLPRGCCAHSLFRC